MPGKTSKKIVISTGAGVLLITLYVLIFSFSAQNSEESGALSKYISTVCVDMFNSFSGGKMSGSRMEECAISFEHPIRKLAHFTEYACMGILVYVLWSQWLKRGRGLSLFTVAWVAVSAAADEIHQLFVPGRDGSLADVCLDTCGGAFGLFICLLGVKVIAGRQRKRAQKMAMM